MVSGAKVIFLSGRRSHTLGTSFCPVCFQSGFTFFEKPFPIPRKVVHRAYFILNKTVYMSRSYSPYYIHIGPMLVYTRVPS